MNKSSFLILVLFLASPANAMTLQISVSGNPAPQDSEYTLFPGQTLILDIHSPDGYRPGDDVYFALVVDTGYGTITGGVAAPIDPNIVEICGDDAQANGMCQPPEDGIWGYIGDPFTPMGPGIYVDEILYVAEDIGYGLSGDAVVHLYTTTDFGQFILADSVTIHQRGLECMKSSAPEHGDWVAWGRPDCWCYKRQCRGDADGCPNGPFWVGIPDLLFFRRAVNRLDSQLLPDDICYDFDHRKTGPFRVSIPDLNILRLYINKREAQIPICPMTHINCWITPDCPPMRPLVQE